MALATQCPHCHTTFRVASDQLKLRGGIVRCGTCQRIFDGNAHLIDLEALAARKASEAAGAGSDDAAPVAEPAPVSDAAPVTPAAPEAPVDEAEAAAPEAAAPSASDDDADVGAQPVYTLDFDHTFDPFGILPKAEPTLDAGMPGRIEPRFDVSADEDTHAEPPEQGMRDAVQDVAVVDSDAAAALPAPGPAPDSPTATPDVEPAPEPSIAPESPLAAESATPPAPAPAPAYTYAPAGRIEPSFDLPVGEALVAQPLRGHEPDPEFNPESALELEPEPAPHPAPHQAPHVDTATADGHAAALPVRAAEADADADNAADTAGAPSAALPLRASADLDAPFAAMETASDAAAPKSARAKANEARARRSKLTPTRIEAPRLRVPASAETDEPEFVKRSRRQERSGRTVRILMAAGAAVLLLLLAAQLLIAYRSELALRYPAARPLLSGLCAAAGCRVGLPAKADNLVIDDGELAPIGTDTYSLNTTLRNQGSLVQAWPSIELELTDANNKPLLRRVFGPADYLPAGAAGAAGTAVANGFGAHSEQPVRLNFALADLKPSGYHTFVFYP